MVNDSARGEFHREFIELLQRGMVSGVIPQNGGEYYSLVQSEDCLDELPLGVLEIVSIGMRHQVDVIAEDLLDPEAMEHRINEHLDEEN